MHTLVVYEGERVTKIVARSVDSESIELPRATDEQMQRAAEQFKKLIGWTDAPKAE